MKFLHWPEWLSVWLTMIRVIEMVWITCIPETSVIYYKHWDYIRTVLVAMFALSTYH